MIAFLFDAFPIPLGCPDFSPQELCFTSKETLFTGLIHLKGLFQSPVSLQYKA